MIGTLIGDLAAWSWENNKELFYSKLISIDIEPSVYGRALLNAANKNLLDNQDTPTESEGQPHTIIKQGEWLMWEIVGSWIDKHQLKTMPVFHVIGKDVECASTLIYSLVKALRNGATKSEAFYQQPMMHHLMQDIKWRNDVDPSELTILGYIIRAWNSFYRGFDFTSSIHDVMKWTGDKHLLGALTGTFADAMYGCKYNLIKEKYANKENTLTEFPMFGYSELHGYNKTLAQKMIETSNNKRTFYPKNNALTNVERHIWKDVQTPFDNRRVSMEQHRRMLKAFTPSWDDRYGFYLDDGWQYIYRSCHLLFRFRLNKLDNDTWVMQNFQSSDDNIVSDLIPIEEAMYSVEHRWYMVSGEKAPKNLEYCKYYHGEPEMPETIKENKRKEL